MHECSDLLDLVNDTKVSTVEIEESPSLDRKLQNSGLSLNNVIPSTDKNEHNLVENSEISLKTSQTAKNGVETKNLSDRDCKDVSQAYSVASTRAPFQSISRGGQSEGNTSISTNKQKKSVSFKVDIKQVPQEAFTSIELSDPEDEAGKG